MKLSGSSSEVNTQLSRTLGDSRETAPCPKRRETHFIPSHSDWVASPCPMSNAAALMHKVWVGQENKMITFGRITLQGCHNSNAISLPSSSPVCSESSAHPLSKSSTLGSVSSSTKVYTECFRKLVFLPPTSAWCTGSDRSLLPLSEDCFKPFFSV